MDISVVQPGALEYIHHCLSIYITHLVHKYLFCLYFFYHVCYTLPGVHISAIACSCMYCVSDFKKKEKPSLWCEYPLPLKAEFSGEPLELLKK